MTLQSLKSYEPALERHLSLVVVDLGLHSSRLQELSAVYQQALWTVSHNPVQHYTYIDPCPHTCRSSHPASQIPSMQKHEPRLRLLMIALHGTSPPRHNGFWTSCDDLIFHISARLFGVLWIP